MIAVLCAVLVHAQELSYFKIPKEYYKIKVDYTFSPLELALVAEITTPKTLDFWTQRLQLKQTEVLHLIGARKWQLQFSPEGFEWQHHLQGFHFSHAFAQLGAKPLLWVSTFSKAQNAWTQGTGLLAAAFCAELRIEKNEKDPQSFKISLIFFFADHRMRNDFRALNLAPLLLTHYREELLFWLRFLAL